MFTCSNFQPSDIAETICVSSSSEHCNTRYTLLVLDWKRTKNNFSKHFSGSYLLFIFHMYAATSLIFHTINSPFYLQYKTHSSFFTLENTPSLLFPINHTIFNLPYKTHHPTSSLPFTPSFIFPIIHNIPNTSLIFPTQIKSLIFLIKHTTILFPILNTIPNLP